ncbi:MAG: hypothetical protein K0R75_2524 [Paenibacillaceae bacterium]|jgi:hypothetical protein|nr:hypothetical protein [Paenibacillaceae bacterium]
MTALLLGKAVVDITPPIGAHLAGWAGERYSNRIHQPLTCRVLYLREGETAAVIVSVDLIGLDKTYSDEIRASAGEKLGLPMSAIMLSATHTHSSPILPPCLFPQHPKPDAHYMEDLKRKVVGACVFASQSFIPVMVGFGRGVGDLGVNRRLPYVNGKSGFPPKADPSQWIDREIGVLRFDALDGGTAAVLFSYGCHPTVGGNTRFMGPDFPGPARRMVESYFGGYGRGGQAAIGSDSCGSGTTALFLLGNCGEIRSNYTNEDGTFRWDVDSDLVEQAGARIGAEVIKAAVTAEPSEKSQLGVGQSFGDLYTIRDEVAIRCEFQAFRIGEAVIVSNPGECFSGIGRKVRERFAFPLLFSSITNGFLGYVPTKEAYPYEGYEVSLSYEFFGLSAPIRSDGEDVFADGMTAAIKQSLA